MNGARPDGTEPNPPEPNAAELRADIDRGRTGDKSGGLDPAAAPLGTDDEAAGSPPSPAAVADARAHERGPPSAEANAAEPDLAPDGEMKRAGRAWIGVAVGAVAAVLVVVVLVFAH